ncbi:hypothetical protein ACLGIH_02370 [Streptomyces sp. HMX87]|uniref:hypothetical protein n=1 Tax=Streptomyces sp. HMX87 TaxID=3390849 RepID=UPI003A89ACEC
MATVNPWFGTAETRHTLSLPKRTVTLPPWDATVYTPDPPPSHRGPPALGSGGRTVGDGRGGGGDGVSRGCCDVRDGVGPGGGAFFLVGVGLGEGRALSVAAGREDDGSSLGADCATGAVGRVEPTTKWIVRTTAVTLAVVHDSQMIR